MYIGSAGSGRSPGLGFPPRLGSGTVGDTAVNRFGNGLERGGGLKRILVTGDRGWGEPDRVTDALEVELAEGQWNEVW